MWIREVPNQNLRNQSDWNRGVTEKQPQIKFDYEMDTGLHTMTSKWTEKGNIDEN